MTIFNFRPSMTLNFFRPLEISNQSMYCRLLETWTCWKPNGATRPLYSNNRPTRESLVQNTELWPSFVEKGVGETFVEWRTQGWLAIMKQTRCVTWKKIQQDKTYHVVDNNTWLATMMHPTKDNLAELHNNNFFLNVSKRGAGATWFLLMNQYLLYILYTELG